MKKILLTAVGAFFIVSLSAQTTSNTENQDNRAKACEKKDAKCCKKDKAEAKCCSTAHGDTKKGKGSAQLPAPVDRTKAPKPSATGAAPKS